MRRWLATLFVLLALAAPAGAQSIRSTYRGAPNLVGLPGLANGRYQNAADVILEQAVRNLPLFPPRRRRTPSDGTPTPTRSSGSTIPCRPSSSPSAGRHSARAC
jgi:hypothetical protein